MADVSASRRQKPNFDLADRLVALQRRTAGPPVVRRAPSEAPQPVASTSQVVIPPPPQSNPHTPQPASHSRPHYPTSTAPPPPTSSKPRRHLRDASPAIVVPETFDDDDDFDRSTPATSRPMAGRLYNPGFDPIPTRKAHRDIEVDSDFSSGPGRPAPKRKLSRHQPAMNSSPPSAFTANLPVPSLQSRQINDSRRQDPILYTVLTRNAFEQSPPSGGYVSASATSASDGQSLGSNLTLNSGTTSSSASNPYSPSNGKELGGNRLWMAQMKQKYREISDLEKAIVSEGDIVIDDELDSSSRHAPLRQQASKASEERWVRLVADHKRLADLYHGFMSFSLKPQVPASLQGLPEKYNIPARLWNHGFQRLIAALRRASISSVVAAEQLESLIIYAYGFYTSTLEEENLAKFRILWLEALGDLSRYQMTVMVDQCRFGSTNPFSSAAHLTLPMNAASVASLSPDPSRMEGSPLPSIGAHAAAEFDVLDDKELWRRNAREWYTKGIKEMPGQGRLHHHLGLVSIDVEGEELRAIYHFSKSLVTNHQCDIARESILPLFSVEKQSSRYSPSTTATNIFVLMHGMLFTRIQLDDFEPSIARFKERLHLFPAEVSEADWIMMGYLNICAILEYGREESVLKKACGWNEPAGTASSQTKPKVQVSKPTLPPTSPSGDSMQVDDVSMRTVVVDMVEEMRDDDLLSGPMRALTTGSTRPELPYTLRLALQLTFEMLEYVMLHPLIPSRSLYKPNTINPYATVILTFLATILKYEEISPILEEYIPWEALIPFMTNVNNRTSSSRSQSSHVDDEKMSKFFGSQPLPEDWCLRGSEWVRRAFVYEFGFWKAATQSKSSSEGGITSEMDVLIPSHQPIVNAEDGVVEGDNEGERNVDWGDSRLKRLRWATEIFVRKVNGLSWIGTGKERVASIDSPLDEKISRWKAEKKREQEIERRRRERIGNSMDMDVDDVREEEEDEEDDVDDTPEVKALKARRRYLKSLQSHSPPPRHNQTRPRKPKSKAPVRPALQVSSGYTILVCDTNILLSSLALVSNLISTRKWTFVVPLAVVTELDGLVSSHVPQLSAAAQEALEYLISTVQTHSTSLKVQTSKGNYLRDLTVRSEQTTLGEGERNMDDLIVRSAIWHMDHFVDRSDMLIPRTTTAAVSDKTSKVVLLTFDRNMRLKARSRKLDAADENDMAAIFKAS